MKPERPGSLLPFGGNGRVFQRLCVVWTVVPPGTGRRSLPGGVGRVERNPESLKVPHGAGNPEKAEGSALVGNPDPGQGEMSVFDGKIADGLDEGGFIFGRGDDLVDLRQQSVELGDFPEGKVL